MKRVVTLLLAIGLSGLILATPILASAYDPVSDICKTAPNTSLCKCNTSGLGSAQCNNPTQNPLTGKSGLIRTVANVLAMLAGIAAVVLIIIAGLRYITSGGDPAAVKGAKDTLVAAVVGIVIIALADALINFVISHV